MKKQISLYAFAFVSSLAQADCSTCPAAESTSMREMANKIEGIEFRFSVSRKPGCDEANWNRIVGMASDCIMMCQNQADQTNIMPEVSSVMCQIADCCKMDKNLEGNLSIGAFADSEETTRQMPMDETCNTCESECQDGVCPAVKNEEVCCEQVCEKDACAENCASTDMQMTA
ncbi:hypothetical protein HYX58_04180 [Candidatus Dependentiae bacterium]|nr:hypothetical protein [Candidatus Dependentiae bacterium]